MTTKSANILHCYTMEMRIKGISAAFELSRNTVRKYVRLFQESGIPMEQLLSMPASRIQEIFGGSGKRERIPSGRQIELEGVREISGSRPFVAAQLGQALADERSGSYTLYRRK